MKASRKKFLVYGLFLSVLAYLAGCGSGQYEARLKKWTNANQGGSKFNLLGAPTAVPGTSLKIRLPISPKSFTLLNEGANPKRLKPGGIDFPGWKATYEAQIEDQSKGQSPYYIYVGSLPEIENVEKRILNELGEKFQPATAWETFTVERPEGGFTDWTKVRGAFSGDFVYTEFPSKKEINKSIPGVFEILYRKSGGNIILLAWRAPKEYQDWIKVNEWIPLVAGALTDGE